MVAELSFICGIHLQMRIPRHNQCADKIYVSFICMRVLQQCVKLFPFTICDMFKDFSLDSTRNKRCAYPEHSLKS